MILLGVNIDHCATVRQARYRGYDQTAVGPVEPDPVALAVRAEQAGADGITIHLREDRRHIQEHDVWRLKDVAKTRINVEMACTPAMIDFGHGINYDNVGEICSLPHVHELNIGHTIISRALTTGIEEAVREMKRRMNG